MKSLVIKGETRTALGKKEAKKIRSQESVPAVLYGSNETIHFSIPFSFYSLLPADDSVQPHHGYRACSHDGF